MFLQQPVNTAHNVLIIFAHAALLHFWLDAKLHFVAMYQCNNNKVESNII